MLTSEYIAPHEIIPLECLRLGLRGDTFYDFYLKNNGNN